MTNDLRAFEEKEGKTKNHNIVDDADKTVVACRLVGCGFLDVEWIVLPDNTFE